MKRVTFFATLLSLFVICSCSVLSRTAENSDDQASALVEQALDYGELCVEIDNILPSFGMARYSNYGYMLKIKDGKVKASLPFFGVSHSPSIYGADVPGIEFNDFPVQIDKSRSKVNKGKYIWTFEAKSGNENVNVTLTFFDNGSASLSCSPANRSTMNYSGKLVSMPEEKQ